MSFKIHTTPRFERSAKALSKRHRSLKSDLGSFIDSLESNPLQGDELSPGIRKIRMAIASKGRGKAGGARVITYNVIVDNVIVAEDSGEVFLLEIYDKSDYSTVDVELIKAMVNDLESDI